VVRLFRDKCAISYIPEELRLSPAVEVGTERLLKGHRMLSTEDRSRAFEACPFVRPGEESNPTLGPTAQRQIATSLRTLYGDLVEEPLPERFLELLAQLDQVHPEQE
jgi:hypothetical protein